jgi:hypothetical protein
MGEPAPVTIFTAKKLITMEHGAPAATAVAVGQALSMAETNCFGARQSQ